MDKKKREKFVKVAVFVWVFLALCCSISSVFGAWSTLGVDGTWTSSDMPVLSGSGANEGRGNYTFGGLPVLANGDGYYLNWTFTIEGLRQEWYWLAGVKRFYFALDFESATGEDVYAWFYVAHEVGIFMNTSEMLVGNEHVNLARPFVISFPSCDVTDVLVQIQLVRVSDTVACVNYAFPLSGDNPITQEALEGAYVKHSENYTVSSGFWASVTAYGFAGHDGSGSFSVDFGDVLTYEDIVPFNDTSFPNVPSNIFTDIYNSLVGGAGFVIAFLAMLWGYLGQFWAFVPLFVVFYFVDVASTSIRERSLQPVGYLATQVWHVVMSAWNSVIHLGELVWDAITFWT